MAILSEEEKLHYTKASDICEHVGDDYAKFMGAITPPIYQSSLFVRPTEKNGVGNDGYVYTRVSNPTTEIAEKKIAALEGADGALCFSSGMAAISGAILHFTKAGGHIVMVATSYGPARMFVKDYLAKKFDVSYTFVKGDSVQEIADAVCDKTTLIYLESPSSAVFKMQDLDAIVKIAKARGIGTIIDNTYATPLHQQPLRHGIDIVCHTASKYMGGHSDIVAGALAANAEIVEAIQHAERELLGSNMDPHQSWLLIRGLRTLPIRLKAHGESGKKVAAFLEGHKNVQKVFYPGSASYGQKELFAKYMTGTNGLMSFVPKGTPEQITKMISDASMFQFGCSWGGFESLIVPISVGMSAEEAAKNDMPANLVRIHVGLEDVDSLIASLDSALNAIG